MLSCESALLLAAGAPDSFSSSAVASASSSLCSTPCFWLLRLPGGDGVLAPVAFSMLTPNDPRTGRSQSAIKRLYAGVVSSHPGCRNGGSQSGRQSVTSRSRPIQSQLFRAHSPRSLHHRFAVGLRRSRSDRTRTCMYMYSGMQVICRKKALLNNAGSASFQVSRTKPHKSSRTRTDLCHASARC